MPPFFLAGNALLILGGKKWDRLVFGWKTNLAAAYAAQKRELNANSNEKSCFSFFFSLFFAETNVVKV
jgi:hypothetical protein